MEPPIGSAPATLLGFDLVTGIVILVVVGVCLVASVLGLVCFLRRRERSDGDGDGSIGMDTGGGFHADSGAGVLPANIGTINAAPLPTPLADSGEQASARRTEAELDDGTAYPQPDNQYHRVPRLENNYDRPAHALAQSQNEYDFVHAPSPSDGGSDSHYADVPARARALRKERSLEASSGTEYAASAELMAHAQPQTAGYASPRDESPVNSDGALPMRQSHYGGIQLGSTSSQSDLAYSPIRLSSSNGNIEM